MKRTALVTGATGLLGRQIILAFERGGWEVVGTELKRARPPKLRSLDLAKLSAISSLLDEVKPQIVVHSAVNRSEHCDAGPEDSRLLNVEATAALSLAASSRKIFMIYISCDVASPSEPGNTPREAASSIRLASLYSQTKLDGEKEVLACASDSRWSVVLRVPILYGSTEDAGESTINTLVDSVWKAQEDGVMIQMDDWQVLYPTNTEDVGRVCQDIALKYLDAPSRPDLPPVLQYSSEESFTKFGICQILAEILGLPLDGMQASKHDIDPKSGIQKPQEIRLSSRDLEGLGIQTWAQDFKAWWKLELKAVRG